MICERLVYHITGDVIQLLYKFFLTIQSFKRNSQYFNVNKYLIYIQKTYINKLLAVIYPTILDNTILLTL